MTPATVRALWIGGLAATGVAVVGVVAYASSKPSASNAPTLVPQPTFKIIKPTAVSIKQGSQNVLIPTTAPGSTPASAFSFTLPYLGQTGLSTPATPGKVLTVTVLPNVFVTGVTLQDGQGTQGDPGGTPAITPSMSALYGNGGTISMTLSGQPGWLLVQGIDSAGHSVATAIQIGSPTGTPATPPPV